MPQEKDNVVPRPPVIVIMGHIDHGKSTLLDYIRHTNITETEAGGITQRLSAYEVAHKDKEGREQKITFLDTPGHEAFSAMRSRGTEIADIALLVIDSSQSVQPQTKEAIAVIKKAQIPMIVVLNKIDVPNSDPEKIKRELLKIDVVVESMSGEIPSVEVSAKEKTGISELLEMILLVADLHNLEMDIKSQVEGVIIESHMDSLKGPIANIIVKKGILNKKDIIVTDATLAKIKILKDSLGNELENVYPGSPATLLGFEKVPGVGEKFIICESVNSALEKIKKRKEKTPARATAGGEIETTVLDNNTVPLTEDINAPIKKVSNIILKGDVLGSLEAIEEMIKSLPQDQVILKILKKEVGDINETDVKLAKMAKAQIIGFRVKINQDVTNIMRNDLQRKVRIKTFNVIYELVQEIRNGMEKSLESENVKVEMGKIKALIIFFGKNNRQIVGGKITDGEIKKGLKLEVIRDEKKVGAGRIISLQRDKKDMDKLSKGDECGILFEGNVKIEKGDILSAYTEEWQKGVL